MRRPINPEPRDRHLTDKEMERIMQGNRTNPHMKFIIELALETALTDIMALETGLTDKAELEQ